ncbi:MAG: Mur ligase family protein, partial [Planctomycetota bacterium]
HGSARNYRRTTLRLLDQLKTAGVAILNLDDPTTHFLLDSIDRPVLTVGVKQEADVSGRLLERSPSEQTFLIQAGSDSVIVRTSIIGDQHVFNCLTAAAVGLIHGISLPTIAHGLESANRIPGRLERVECGQDYGVWIDSSKTPGQLAHAIRTLKQVTQGKLWCICSTEEGQSDLQRRKLGSIAEKGADEVVVTRTSLAQSIDYEPAHQVLDGFKKPGKAHVIPNRFRAVEFALQQAKQGDAVLVSGCGERPFAMVGEDQWTINDRDVVEAWLYDHAFLSPMEIKNPNPKSQIFKIDDYRD